MLLVGLQGKSGGGASYRQTGHFNFIVQPRRGLLSPRRTHHSAERQSGGIWQP